MKKTIVLFAMFFLLMSLPFISVVSAHQQKESAKQAEKVKVAALYRKMIMVKNAETGTNASFLVRLLATIFIIWYTRHIFIPVIVIVAVVYIFHCFIWNPLKVLFEVWYLKRHPEVEPW